MVKKKQLEFAQLIFVYPVKSITKSFMSSSDPPINQWVAKWVLNPYHTDRHPYTPLGVLATFYPSDEDAYEVVYEFSED